MKELRSLRPNQMLQKTKTFLEVARLLSFTEASYTLGVSQSAVSQTVAALERELGVALIERSKRKIALTPAGLRFANEASRLVSAFDELVESIRNSRLDGGQTLRIAYLNVYRGAELQRAVMRFSMTDPNTRLDVQSLSHEEIYEALLCGQIDLALSDQRRAFSEDFENTVLAETPIYVELSANHPFAEKKRLSVSELKHQNCILVAPKALQGKEQTYYADLLGFRGSFLFAETLGAARLMVSGGRGFLLSQGSRNKSEEDSAANFVRLPLFKSGRLIRERFCAFYLKAKNSSVIEAFSAGLKHEFANL